MADNSDVAKALWDALPRVDGDPEMLELAPIIDGWALYTSPNEREVAIRGTVAGSGKFGDGRSIFTSALRTVDDRARYVVTQNSVYRLGWPERVSLSPDGAYAWPPALAVAAEQNWPTAVRKAVEWTGRHTLADDALIAIEDAVEADWPEALAVARDVATAMREAGRHQAADAWLFLSTDVMKADERKMTSDIVARDGEQAASMYARDLTHAEEFAGHGWRTLAEVSDETIICLIAGATMSRDPVAAAHAAGMAALRPKSLLEEVYIAPEVDYESPPERAPGIVVLREIGGTSASATGKEVRAEFRKMLGKSLPLAPVGDLAAARSRLHAEFPHASEQIDVTLSDLSGAEHVRFRPTLLVGEPGGGKSRLVRRLAETLGVPLHRFDGAGSSDNAFGGTPRRYSSGEHSAPLEAVRKHGVANPIVFVDEIDKAGRNRQNGSLGEALMPFLEVETARSYPDPYVQAEVDLSHVSYLLTANKDEDLPSPLRDRLRIIRLSRPTIEHVPALTRGIVADFARERGGDPRWWPELDEVELAIAEELWAGGSVRKLRTIVERLLAARERAPRH